MVSRRPSVAHTLPFGLCLGSVTILFFLCLLCVVVGHALGFGSPRTVAFSYIALPVHARATRHRHAGSKLNANRCLRRWCSVH